ncbi:MAG TPA: DPP IV N-terminal domain-containing protein [Bryobacteraceae bacterium]|nr:DPP IV N-terminal domain-containing protein [Bryobacteraceae bacterium]
MKLSIRVLLVLLPCLLQAQGTLSDYERAQNIRQKFRGLAVNIAEPANWLASGEQFWYRKSVAGGNEFVLVDANTLAKKPAFDQEKLAAGLSKAAGESYKPFDLPFTDFHFTDGQNAIEFAAAGSLWKCALSNYVCKKTGTAQAGAQQFRRRRGPQADFDDNPADPQFDESPAEPQNDVEDGMVIEDPVYDSPQQQTQRGPQAAGRGPERPRLRTSPDGKWEAAIWNFNVMVREKGKTEAYLQSFDGSEGNYYTLASLTWSPDSKHLVAYRVRPGYHREVYYVESSPTDQVQPKHSSREYAKPGDTLDIAQPVMFQIGSKKEVMLDNSLFPNPYSLSRPVWWKDSRGFTFEYNQRGHQVYRVIEADAETGKCRTLINEESPTFVDYRPLVPNPRDTGKKYRYDLNDGKQIIWASERDGWEHLYLYNGRTGELENQITKGDWVVRTVEKVDEANRQIWFEASGMYPGKDPYFINYYRINFDGSGLTRFTDADANHTVKFSPDMKYYVDTWSRVDLPTVSELRRTSDKKLLLKLEQGDITALKAAGWRAPEVFTALGRDGKTDIWGVIYKPTNFDPSKKYPVVESIYAGPQGSFVPKTFSPIVQPLAELGFIVVQIDGMGTNNRSKAFHNVAWKNLGDAGFPDRILWHKAVAAKYPWYDISRVGVYGTSAGGQNAMGALLFHPEFYKVAVSNSGCHDNRMDKIWWNEQWMGWPLGPQYVASSNVENASKLQGKLLLVVGEMDSNVDPSSTLQVVNALIKAGKKFNLLYVPGGEHGAGGLYGQRLLEDFFVHNLLSVEPPDWNRMPEETPAARRGGRNVRAAAAEPGPAGR